MPETTARNPATNLNFCLLSFRDYAFIYVLQQLSLKSNNAELMAVAWALN